ncbi:MAG: methyltransferase [Melioribacteraceae bacterium]|nr:MAG: methyltransferase [Melioribacteraceae bacterium]
MSKSRAPGNRTIVLSEDEIKTLSPKIIHTESLKNKIKPDTILCGDIFEAIKFVPENSVDLLFLDPPYNLSRKFESNVFNKTTEEKYTEWFDSWFKLLMPSLKDDASVYVCGDWKTSISIYQVIKNYLKVRNRITWEREKGRGAKTNFKNSHEDIWFATKSDNYTFNLDDIKMKRKVLAPYRENGKPKDWDESADGNFRLTHPSNFWNDISVPFWSMPENTDHPTQKPEKLVAKLILASTNENDVVFDPFLGSGTTAVVAKKLNRRYYGVELSEEYNMLSYKRLEMAENDTSIQGYFDGVFWERNTLSAQKKEKVDGKSNPEFQFGS